MNALLIALLLTQAADAPLAVEPGHATAEVIAVPRGEVVPWPAVCMTEDKAMLTAKELAGLRSEVVVLRDTHISPLAVVVIAVSAAVVAGVTVGGVVYATTNRPR